VRVVQFTPLDRSISAVALGLYPLAHVPRREAFEVLDSWLDVGGDVVDTAPAYGDGASERALGEYMRVSGCRSDVVILTKACHPGRDGRPRLSPAAITEDLSGSLERLGVDTIDIYMLHRDDVEQPVGPLVEQLNEEIRGGRIRSFGVSNWTPARISEARRFSEVNGLVPITSSSAHMSLAEEVTPLAPTAVSVSRKDVDFYHRTGLPLFAWASLAEGWFRGGNSLSGGLGRFDSLQNRERRHRAASLAETMGVTATQICMAWLLCQPLTVFGIFASLRPHHIREMAAASTIQLDDDSLRWLDLRSSGERFAPGRPR
jgi:aryl-alcohol dehydrogenase-like predicted oxidoreductase